MAGKRTALVVCPGRGVYNKPELGYFRRFHPDRTGLIEAIDAERRAAGQEGVQALDAAEAFEAPAYSRGDNAASLIFACSYADFLALDRERIEIVAVTGNSMGWYTALACGGALAFEDAVRVVNSMGRLTHEGLVGGQALYPVTDEDWRPIPGRREALLEAAAAARAAGEAVFLSIDLGGFLVFAGSDAGLQALAGQAPASAGRYPLRLVNHGAFHSPLMAGVSAKAQAAFTPASFRPPQTPLIDGRGKVWRPFASDPAELCDYTFNTQVTEPYDFAAAIRVAMREFAPDVAIVLGPGDTLGGSVAQSLIRIDWRGLDSKAGFAARQAETPVVISLGRPDQRALAVAAAPSRQPVEA